MKTTALLVLAAVASAVPLVLAAVTMFLLAAVAVASPEGRRAHVLAVMDRLVEFARAMRTGGSA